MTTLALVPLYGQPVVLPAAGWQATVDLVQQRGVVHDTLVDGLRQAPGVHVTEPQARQIAWCCETAAGETEVADEDRAGLQRLAEFCRTSGGFAVLSAEPRPAAAPPAVVVGPSPAPVWQRRLRRVLGPFAVVVIAALQWLAKLKVLLLFLPKVKFLGTAVSALVSIGVYALFWGWRFAALFVALLFMHELGHVIQLRREGIGATAPMFVPFMGAFVGLKKMPGNAWVEAKVGLAGPVLGTAAAIALYGVGVYTHSDLIRAAAHVGLLLNLFNLAPVTPLDGGRAAAALHPYVWIGGVFALAMLAFAYPNSILFLILIFAAFDAFHRLQAYRRHDPAVRAYYSVRPWQRVAVAAVYFGLAAILVVAFQASNVPRPG